MFSNTSTAPPPVHKYSSQTTNNSVFNTIIPHYKLFNKLFNRLLNVNPQMCKQIDLKFPSQLDSGSQIQLSATRTPGAKYWCTSKMCAFSPTVHALFFFLLTNDCRSNSSSPLIFKFSNDTTIEGLITNADESAYREEVEWVVDWCTNNDLSFITVHVAEHD